MPVVAGSDACSMYHTCTPSVPTATLPMGDLVALLATPTFAKFVQIFHLEGLVATNYGRLAVRAKQPNWVHVGFILNAANIIGREGDNISIIVFGILERKGSYARVPSNTPIKFRLSWYELDLSAHESTHLQQKK